MKIHKRIIRRHGKNAFIEPLARFALDKLKELDEHSIGSSNNDRFWPIEKRVNVLSFILQNAIDEIIDFPMKELFYKNYSQFESGLKPEYKSTIYLCESTCMAFYETKKWEAHISRALSIIDSSDTADTHNVIGQINALNSE